MVEKRCCLFSPWVKSFYSADLYRNVAKTWTGTGYWYLFVLLAVCWIPLVAKFIWVSQDLQAGLKQQVAKEMPKVTINNGEVSVDAQMPMMIRGVSGDDPVLVIDTSGQTQSLDNSSAKVLITNDKVITKDSHGNQKIHQIPKTLNTTIDKEKVQGWLNASFFWLFILVYPVLLLLSFGYRILQTILYAAVGTLIFNKVIKTSLDYHAILRLSVIAITPALIISTVMGYFGVSIDYEWSMYLLLSMLYLFFGLHANRNVQIEDAEPKTSDEI